jgi:predicted outer membrane repeat protein
VTIAGNAATSGSGGGIYSTASSPVLTNVVISGNTANDSGGGIYNQNSPAVLTNVTIVGNRATNASGTGGGIDTTNNTLQIRNSIIWGNTAASYGNINNAFSTLTISYSIVEGSSAGSWWSTNAVTDGGGNQDSNPNFVALEPAASAPTTVGDYHLLSGPAVDAGPVADTYYPDTWAKWQSQIESVVGASVGLITDVTAYNTHILPYISKDRDGNPRIIFSIDMGAYEKQ